MNMIIYHKMRYDLANEFLRIGAVLTKESDHPLVVERAGQNGKERGFLSKFHENNPGASLLPIFFNFRTPDNPKPGPLIQEVVNLAARCMHMMADCNGLNFDAVAGVPRAGWPFAEAFSKIGGTCCISLDKWEYNGRRRVESLKGFIPVHVKKVLVIDDLIHSGRSKRETIDVFLDGGMDVADVAVLADYELGGREELDELDCNLHSVFTVRELIDFYVAEGKMKPRLRDEIQAYLAA